MNIVKSLQIPVKQKNSTNKASSIDATKFEKKFYKFIRSAVRENKFQYLENLDLSYLGYFTCDHLESILSECNNSNRSSKLVTLNLAHCKKLYVSKRNAHLNLYENVIADHCPNLISLNLAGMQVCTLEN